MTTWNADGYTWKFEARQLKINNNALVLYSVYVVIDEEEIEVRRRTFTAELSEEDCLRRLWPIGNIWEAVLSNGMILNTGFKCYHEPVFRFICREMNDLSKVPEIGKALLEEGCLDQILNSKYFSLVAKRDIVLRILENLRVAHALS